MPPPGIWGWSQNFHSQAFRWLICDLANRVSSTVLPRKCAGTTPLCAAHSEGQDQLPLLIISRPALSPATDNPGCCWGISPSPHQFMLDEGWVQTSHTHVLRLAHSCPINKVSYTVLLRRGEGSTLPSVAAGEGQDQLSRLLQVA